MHHRLTDTLHATTILRVSLTDHCVFFSVSQRFLYKVEDDEATRLWLQPAVQRWQMLEAKLVEGPASTETIDHLVREMWCSCGGSSGLGRETDMEQTEDLVSIRPYIVIHPAAIALPLPYMAAG